MTEPDQPVVPADGHAGDLVSARLDGELDAATTRWVDEHLEACDACRDVAGAVDVARRWMQAAPTVDSSPVVGGVIARRRRLVGTGLVFVGLALFVLGILALTSSVAHPRVVPPVDDFVAAHERADHGELDGMRPVEAVGEPYATPVVLGTADAPFERRSVYDGADLTVAVYDDGTTTVTVYEQPGRLDWSELPAGSLVPVVAGRTWTRLGSPAAVVTEVGDLVVTFVADDPASIEAVAATFRAPRRTSTVARVHDSCQRLMRVFALGG